MDFWVWIAILIIAWLLEAVGSAAKKKRLERERELALGPSAPRKVFLPEPLQESEVEEDEAPQFVVEVPVQRALRPRGPEISELLEGVSAEVVDRAEAPAAESAGPQHVRALEKYGPAHEAAATPAAPRHRLALRPATLRDAVLWTEILGRPKGALILAFALAAQSAAAQVAPSQRYDVLISGGVVVDGTGAERYRADVAITGGRIVRVSRQPLPATDATRVIDARGRVIAPGFIDMHAHLDPLLRLPGAESMARQGVTTALGGPDGGSPVPLGRYLDSAQALGLGINVAMLIGHNTIRQRVMGLANRAPTAAELARMKDLVAQGMRDGAFGLSTGLRYLPGTFSNTDEVVALAAVAAESHGIYTSHLREEGLGLIEGVAEAMEIGRRARIPIVLTHHKAVGQPMWGASVRTLAMVDSARAAGTDVMMDQYPYTATYTGISVLVPSSALAGGDTAFLRRLTDTAQHRLIVDSIVFNLMNDRGGGDLRRVQFARVAWQPDLEGKTLYDWATTKGDTTVRGGANLVIEAVRRGGANAIYHVLDEADVERIMRHPQTMIGSDGRLVQPGDGHPHPRWYGTFPRVLGVYVRDKGVLTLEQAIHKMTELSARRLGLSDRGRIAEGLVADIVLFDPATVRDRATFERPHQYPEGIAYVLVNGVAVVDQGNFTNARSGKALRRP